MHHLMILMLLFLILVDQDFKTRPLLGIFIWYVLIIIYICISLKPTRRSIRESFCNVARLKLLLCDLLRRGAVKILIAT